MAEIEQRLWNEFGIKVSNKSKAYKKQLLDRCISRPPLTFKLDAGDLRKRLEENRQVFDVIDKKLWQPIKNVKKTDIPNSYDELTITIFLRDSQVKVNGEFLESNAIVPKSKLDGQGLYDSENILTCKFAKTSSMLIFDAQIFATMRPEQRYVIEIWTAFEQKIVHCEKLSQCQLKLLLRTNVL